MGDSEIELLLALHGSSFEMAPGIIVEFVAQRAAITPERPHGLRYALVLRHRGGDQPWLRFDNAHGVGTGSTGYRRKRLAYDHWHQTETDEGRPYNFTTAVQLLDDFWREVKRVLDEKGIRHDL